MCVSNTCVHVFSRTYSHSSLNSICTNAFVITLIIRKNEGHISTEKVRSVPNELFLSFSSSPNLCICCTDC